MAHSTPIAEIKGRATVTEHLPKQDTSCIVTILFIFTNPFFDFMGKLYNQASNLSILNEKVPKSYTYVQKNLDKYLKYYYNKEKLLYLTKVN